MQVTKKKKQNNPTVDSTLVKSDTESRKAKLEIGGAFQEVRCKSCNALLYKVRFLQKGKQDLVEIKCRRCGKINS